MPSSFRAEITAVVTAAGSLFTTVWWMSPDMAESVNVTRLLVGQTEGSTAKRAYLPCGIDLLCTGRAEGHAAPCCGVNMTLSV